MADITEITVIVQIDGRMCLAPIRPDAADLFIGMLPAFQPGGEDRTTAATLVALPPDLAAHIHAFGQALGRNMAAKKEPTNG